MGTTSGIWLTWGYHVFGYWIIYYTCNSYEGCPNYGYIYITDWYKFHWTSTKETISKTWYAYHWAIYNRIKLLMRYRAKWSIHSLCTFFLWYTLSFAWGCCPQEFWWPLWHSYIFERSFHWSFLSWDHWIFFSRAYPSKNKFEFYYKTLSND